MNFKSYMRTLNEEYLKSSLDGLDDLDLQDAYGKIVGVLQKCTYSEIFKCKKDLGERLDILNSTDFTKVKVNLRTVDLYTRDLTPIQKELDLSKIREEVKYPIFPVIVFRSRIEDRTFILDGHHRWAKCFLNNVEKIPCIVLESNLTITELMKILALITDTQEKVSKGNLYTTKSELSDAEIVLKNIPTLTDIKRKDMPQITDKVLRRLEAGVPRI